MTWNDVVTIGPHILVLNVLGTLIVIAIGACLEIGRRVAIALFFDVAATTPPAPQTLGQNPCETCQLKHRA
jgi:hypothetical protein